MRVWTTAAQLLVVLSFLHKPTDVKGKGREVEVPVYGLKRSVCGHRKL